METLEYYYALASPWSFIGNSKLIEIAAAHNLTIDPIIIDYDKCSELPKHFPFPPTPYPEKKVSID
ncbi:MAG: hypothetical protein CM1200mP41_31210 [Gammaproteobacteria bacterium]|nr:MAG: hypothetical protein CM1200mP41_31210 [Gammaproteobacteria bacterium]